MDELRSLGCSSNSRLLILRLTLVVVTALAAEYAGTETIFEEIFPGEHDFYYPVIYAGEANNCKVSIMIYLWRRFDVEIMLALGVSVRGTNRIKLSVSFPGRPVYDSSDTAWDVHFVRSD